MKKVAIISGGSSGLGLEIARLLVREGRNVVILGRNGEKLSGAVRKLGEYAQGSYVGSFICNVGSDSDIRSLGNYLTGNKLIAEYLFNNAGRGLIANACSSAGEMIDAVFEPNLKGMILLTSEILRLTPAEEELSIINIMSTSALVGRSGETIYCAAKWGARGYTEALRTELKGEKRNIIAVYPGGMKTEFWQTADKNRNISGFMDPHEVAGKIVQAVTGSGRLSVTDITINRK